MKRTKKTFVGSLPITTGSPAIVRGGFNLDKTTQSFAEGTIIPAGTPCIFDEVTRKVLVLKAGKVTLINATDSKVVSLKKSDFYEPIFNVGDHVAKAGSVSGTFAASVYITAIDNTGDEMVITLSAAISGLAVDDTLVQVIANSSNNAAVIGECNGMTLSEVTVLEDETAIDCVHDTMQYAYFINRINAIPTDQLSTNGLSLKANTNVKFTKAV